MELAWNKATLALGRVPTCIDWSVHSSNPQNIIRLEEVRRPFKAPYSLRSDARSQDP